MRLDRLARRYATDPWSVLQWAPERIALAQMAADAAELDLYDDARRRADSGHGITMTLDLGRA